MQEAPSSGIRKPPFPPADHAISPQSESPFVGDSTVDSYGVILPAQPTEHPTLVRLASTPRRKIPRSLWLLAFLIPYAITATIGLVYLWRVRPAGVSAGYLLESLPDQGLYEDFLDARRRESIPPVSNAGDKNSNQQHIAPTEEIPAFVPAVQLGQTRRVGALAVTPLEVRRQRLQYAYKQGQRNVPGDTALVLKLEVRNEGQVIFRPDDETFNRAYVDDARLPLYTYLEIGNQRYYGAITDPVTERLDFPACPSLLPDESAFVYITALHAAEGKRPLFDALKKAREPLLWRVHLRRGKEEVTLSSGRRRQVWLTSVVPVQFLLRDIQNDT